MISIPIEEDANSDNYLGGDGQSFPVGDHSCQYSLCGGDGHYFDTTMKGDDHSFQHLSRRN